MLPKKPVKKRTELSYLLWFLFFSLLIHSIILILLTLFSFKGGSFNKFKDLFNPEKKENEPTFVMFHDEKPAIPKEPETQASNEKEVETQPLQEKNPAEQEEKNVEPETQEPLLTQTEQGPPPTPIITTSPAKLVAPISSFGYPDAQAEQTLDPELPDSHHGDIVRVESATAQQPKEAGVLEKKHTTKKLDDEPTEGAAPIQQVKKSKTQKKLTPKKARTIQKAHHEDIQDILVKELKSSVIETVQAATAQELESHQDIDIPDTQDFDEIQTNESISSPLLAKIRDTKEPSDPKTTELDIEGPEMVVRGARKDIPDEAPRKKNIIALTKGFIEKLSGESGTDLVDRDGDPNKRPTFEELKFLSYEAKINWALQASWKQNIERSQRHKAVPGTVDVAFVINAQGIPQNITIMQSSGMPELDDTIVYNIKNAAPFPPIPEHLNMAEYPVRRSIRVYLFGRGF